MQRLLSLRLLTKKQPITNMTSKTNPIHPQHAYGSLVSHYSTTALSNSGLKPQNIYGFFSNSVLLNQFLQNSSTLLKGPSKGLVDFKWVFSRSYFLQKKSSYNVSSFKSFSQGKRWIQRLDSDNVVLGLIVANVAVFLLWRTADYQFMANNFMISLDNFKSGRVHTMITSAFSHIDAGHIISNMIGLYFFGNSIGSAFGPEYLLKLYLAGALAGSVFCLVYDAFLIPSKSNQMWGGSPSTAALGASGAVNAIMLLDIFLNPKKTILFQMFIPVPAILVGIFIIGKDMLRILEGDSQVSGSAHLGGAAVAALAWARFRKGRFY
ncbi:RHOMBOID-like protein 12, mitochondrial [Apium graveolens]|uniref:RHOMBOID-like protein 12, mitochondrial n=1 Tax=Apium graveolens TaxID=4045 RepID=UPI003D78B944